MSSENIKNINMSQEELAKAANNLGKKTKEFVEQQQEDFDKLAQTCSESIKKNPLKSVLLGFTVGFILGKILTK